MHIQKGVEFQSQDCKCQRDFFFLCNLLLLWLSLLWLLAYLTHLASLLESGSIGCIIFLKCHLWSSSLSEEVLSGVDTSSASYSWERDWRGKKSCIWNGLSLEVKLMPPCSIFSLPNFLLSHLELGCPKPDHVFGSWNAIFISFIIATDLLLKFSCLLYLALQFCEVDAIRFAGPRFQVPLSQAEKSVMPKIVWFQGFNARRKVCVKTRGKLEESALGLNCRENKKELTAISKWFHSSLQ